jgi:hypothetical protein
VVVAREGEMGAAERVAVARVGETVMAATEAAEREGVPGKLRLCLRRRR